MISRTGRLAPTAVRPTKLVPPETAFRTLASTGTQSVVSHTGSGVLLGLVFRVQVAPTGNPTARINVNIDAAGVENISVFTAANLWDAEWIVLGRNPGVTAVVDGNAIGDMVYLALDLPYNVSCVVDIDVTVAGSAGELRVVVQRGETV